MDEAEHYYIFIIVWPWSFKRGENATEPKGTEWDTFSFPKMFVYAAVIMEAAAAHKNITKLVFN